MRPRPRQIWVDQSFFDLTKELKAQIQTEIGRKPSDSDITADIASMFRREGIDKIVERKLKYRKKSLGRFF